MSKKTLTDLEAELDTAPNGVVPVVDTSPTDAMAMPGSVTQHGVVVERETFTRTPYATFCSTKSKSWGRLAIALPGLEDSDAVLVMPEPDMPIKLAPFRFSLVTARQFFAVMDQEGQIESCCLNKQLPGMKEFIESILVVLTPDGKSVAARMTWKTTKCAAAHKAIAALKMCETPKWGTLSEAHKQSLSAPHAWMRYTATSKLGPTRTSKSGPGAGYTYRAADAVILPTGPTEWMALSHVLTDKDAREVFAKVGEAYERRMRELEEAHAATQTAIEARNAKGR